MSNQSEENSQIEVSEAEGEQVTESEESVPAQPTAVEEEGSQQESSGEEEEEEDEAEGEGEEEEDEDAEGEEEEAEEENNEGNESQANEELEDKEEKEDQPNVIIAEAPTNDMEIDEMLAEKESVEEEEINTQLTIEQDCPIESECVYRKALIEEVSTNDIPERLQYAFENRLDPSEDELKKEADFIFYHFWKDEKHKKASEKQKKELKTVIQKVLEEYRRKRNDIPFIEKYRSYLTNNLLSKDELWVLAKLDLKWNEYMQLSKSVSLLLEKIRNSEIKDNLEVLIKNSFGEIAIIKNIKSYLLEKLSYFSDQFDNRVYIDTIGDLHYSQIIEKFYDDWFISPWRLTENITKSKKLNSPPVINKDLIDVVKSYFGSEEVNTISFNTAVSKYIACDIANYPGLLDYYQKMYIQHASLSTKPTEGWEKDIDILDQWFSFKRLKNVPFNVISNNPEAWLYICKLQKDEKIQVEHHTDRLAEALNKELFNFFSYNEKDKKKEKKGKKSKDDTSKIIEKWEGFYRQIISQSVQKVWEKVAIEWIDQKLRAEATKEIEHICAESFKNYASKSYSQDWNETVMAIFYNNSNDTLKYWVENAPENKESTSLTQDKFEEFMKSKDTFLDKIEKVVEDFSIEGFTILINWSEWKLIWKELNKRFSNKPITEVPYDDLFKALIRNSAKIFKENNSDSQPDKEEININEDLLNVSELLGAYTMFSLNFIGGLWKDNGDKNAIWDFRFHPLQSELDKQSLWELLRVEMIKIVNENWLDISEFDANLKLLQFVCGIGTRKYTRAVRKIRKNNLTFERRQDILESQIFSENVLKNCIGFLAFKSLSDFDNLSLEDSNSVTLYLDSSRIHPEHYSIANDIITQQQQNGISTFGELKKSLVGLDVDKYWAKLGSQSVDLAWTVQFIVSELQEPWQLSLIEESIDKIYALSSILNDPFCTKYKEGAIVRFEVNQIDEENKQIKQILNSIWFTISNLEDENIKEQYPVGKIFLTRIKSISLSTFEIEWEFWEVDDDLIKRKWIKKYLREYFEIKKDIDIANLYTNGKQKISTDQTENQDIKMNEDIDYWLDFYNISERSYLKSKESEVRNTLKSGEIGEYYFHKADNNEKQLKLSWKFYDEQIFTFPVSEKVIEDQNKEMMEVDDFLFETEKQIALDYWGKYAEMVLDVYNHSKFQVLKSIKEMIEYLKYKRAIERYEISFWFTILKEYPKTVVLGYIKKTNRLVIEFIDIKKTGYTFHNTYFCSITAVEEYFRSNHNTKVYNIHIKNGLNYRKRFKSDCITHTLPFGASRITYLPMLFRISLISLSFFKPRDKKRLDKFIFQESKKELSGDLPIDPTAQKNYWDSIYKKVEEEQNQRRLEEEKRMQERRSRGRGGRGRGRGGLRTFEDDDESRANRPYKRRRFDENQEQQEEGEKIDEEGAGWGDIGEKKVDSNLGWNSENSGNKKEIKDWNKQGNDGWKGGENNAESNEGGWGNKVENSNTNWNDNKEKNENNDNATSGWGGEQNSWGDNGNTGGGETSWGGSGDNANNDSGESRPRGERSNKGWFKCGGDHMARDCTSEDTSRGRGGRGRGRAWFKCGNEGHMSREWTESGGNNEGENRGRGGRGRGGRGRSCFKCGNEGHMSRECPESGENSGGNNNGGSDNAAWGSGATSGDTSSAWGAQPSSSTAWGGESAANTTTDGAWGSSNAGSTSNADGGWGSSAPSAGSTGWGSTATTSDKPSSDFGSTSWGTSGDTSKDNNGWGGSGGGETSWGGSGDNANNDSGESRPRGERSNKGWFKCGGDHMARDCTSEDTSRGRGGRGRGRAWFKCGNEGHMSREWTESGGNNEGENRGRGGRGRGGRGRSCFKCGNEGHMSRECPESGENSGGNNNGGSDNAAWGSGATSGDTSSAWGAQPSSSTAWGGESAANTTTDGAWGSSNAGSTSNADGGWGSTATTSDKPSSDFGSTSWGTSGDTSKDNNGWGGSGGGETSWGGSGDNANNDSGESRPRGERSNKGWFKCGGDHMARDCTSEDTSRGRGGRGRGRAWFKCGNEGHMSREWTESGGNNEGENRGRGGRGRGGRGRSCFKCGNEGHMSRECPESGENSGGNNNGGSDNAAWGSGATSGDTSSAWGAQPSSSTAWGGESAANTTTDGAWGSSNAGSTSNADGGWGSTATTSDKPSSDFGSTSWGTSGDTSKDNNGWGGSGGGETSWGGSGDNANNDSGESRPRGERSNKGWFKCGGDHMARDCTSEDTSRGRGGRGRGRAWFKCGNEGHMSREWTESGGNNERRGGRGRACFKCGNEGHMSREWTESGGNNEGENRGRGGRGRGGRGRACFKCGNEGHTSRDCTESGGNSGGNNNGGSDDAAWGSSSTTVDSSSAWGASSSNNAWGSNDSSNAANTTTTSNNPW